MPRTPLLAIAIFFLVGGLSHFIFADLFIRIMPDYLPYHEQLVLVSGIFEILGAIGILIPRTRLWAGYGLIALLIAVFPANIDMALHHEKYPELPVVMLYLRLPLQLLFIGFIAWAISPERRRHKNTAL